MPQPKITKKSISQTGLAEGEEVQLICRQQVTQANLSITNSYTITENEIRTEQTKIKSEVKCKTGYV